MVATAKKNLKKKRVHADIQRGNVESLPFENDFFDTVLSTMAFSGYPDGDAAMSEMKRVLKPGGRLIILDVNYPSSRNFIGLRLVKMWQSAGDIIRDMSELFKKYDLEYSDEEVGGAGTVHLYVAQKNS